MKDLSIIIVSWNARQYLEKCLLSIRETSGSRLREIIVVDNHSSDGSPEMVAAKFPDVRLIRLSENVGFARANNVGIKEASGAFLALINSDVLVHADCLDRLCHFLETRPEAGLVGPKVLGGD